MLVFREGLETILVLAAITAGLLGGNRAYRRPVALGGVAAAAATVATWFGAVWVIGMFGNPGLDLGSYFAVQWLKVWRPRRRGQPAAHIADRPPAAPVGAGPRSEAA